MVQQHGEDAKNIEKNFKVLRKCRGKFECLLYEMSSTSLKISGQTRTLSGTKMMTVQHSCYHVGHFVQHNLISRSNAT